MTQNINPRETKRNGVSQWCGRIAFAIMTLMVCASASEVRANTYTFSIVSRSNTIVLSYTKTVSDLSQAVALHEKYLSPSATNFHYYSTQAAAYANDGSTDLVSSTFSGIADNSVIYVGYDYDGGTHLDLSGGTAYSMKSSGNYFLKATTISDHIGQWNYAADSGEDNMRWTFHGSDPYLCTIKSAAYPTYFLSASFNSGNIGNGHTGTQFRLYSEDTAHEVRYFSILADNHLICFAQNGGNTYAMYENGTWFRIYGGGSKTAITDESQLTGLYNSTGTATISSPQVFTFHVVDGEGNVVESASGAGDVGETLTLPYRTRLERIGCTLSTKYYTDATCLTEVTTIQSGVTDYYIPYTFDAAALKSATGLVFSTESDPVWFNLQVGGSNRNISYNSSNDELPTAATYTTDAQKNAAAGQWAFIGDPYGMKIINRADPTKAAYAASSANGTKVYLREYDPDYCLWVAQSGTKGTAFQLKPKGMGLEGRQNYWNPAGGSGSISLYSSSDDYKGADNNLFVLPVRYFTYHVVNKSNTVAISKMVNEDYATTSISLPSELQSPYIPLAANYKFFNTQAAALAYTTAADAAARSTAAAAAITTLSEVTGTDIYVGYYWDGTVPSGLPKLDGSRWYQMPQKSGYYWFAQTVDTRARYDVPADEDAAQATKYLWHFTGNDPYAIYISNRYYNELQNDGSEYLLKGLNGQNAYSWIEVRFTKDSGTPHILVNTSSSGYYSLIALGFNSVVGTDTYTRALRGNTTTDPYSFYMKCNYTGTDNWNQLQFTEVPIAEFTFHLFTRQGNALPTVTETHRVNVAESISLPEVLRRKYISSYQFFTAYDGTQASYEDRFSGEVTDLKAAFDAGKTDIYVKYTVGTLPFDISTDYAHARWYRMTAQGAAYTRWNSTQLVAGEGGLANTTYTHDYQYAFFGDPYELKMMNRDGGDQYLGSATLANGQVIAPMAGGSQTWEVVFDTNDASQFQLRSFGTAASPFYAGYQGCAAVCHSSTPMTMTVEALPQRTYTYHIIANNAREAISATVAQDVTTPITYENLPASIRSPYIADETLTGYLTATATGSLYDLPTYNLSSPMAETPIDGGTDIYIRYTTEHLAAKPLKLDGSRSYYVQNPGNSHYAYAGSSSAIGTNAEKTTSPEYIWNLLGGDPYAMYIQNVSTKNYVKLSGGAQSLDGLTQHSFFILMAGTSDATPTLLQATGGDAASAPSTSLTFSSDLGHITYYIIDRQHKVVITAEDDSPDLVVPVEVQSPLVSRYHYWAFSSLAANADGSGTPDATDPDATYYVKDGAIELSSIGAALGEGNKVYVTYDVANENMFANSEHYRAKGYDPALGSDNETPPMYLLRFLHGETFHQEDGRDGLMTTAQQAVYPYNNGDAGLNIYGEEQWQTQLENAATTRGRWPWFIESETLDPYHVYVSSRQSQASSYSYLRTYVPDGYAGGVVTGVITKNPAVTDRMATDVPTEYMILGTTGHGLFWTVSPVSGSSKPADTYAYLPTLASREKITNFEQYWKNNPMANNLLAAGGLEKVTAIEEAVSLTAEQRSFLKSENAGLNKRAWHSYSAWANAAPWAKRTDGTTNKKYEYKEHWFSTISMGYGVSEEQAGEFALEETSLAATLILLDRHGWEIARLNLPNGPDDPTRAEKYAALQKYSSPMVERYHYWKTGSKVPGYHKFTVSDYAVDENGQEYTTARLGFLDPAMDGLLPDYELQGKVGNMSRDWYVTYDVKAEYADSYRATATEPADIASAASAFMLGQGNGSATQWAQTTDGATLTATTMPATYGAITDGMLWYLRPNFDIDREMGYLYQGETGAQDEALSKAETDRQNYDEGRNGFDPYNVQVQSKAFLTSYLTTAATAAALDAGVWQGPATTVGLKEKAVRVSAQGHDQKTIRGTNATFMVVDDGNGNMRLMPRFDHTHVVAALGTVAAQATPAPAADKTGTQTTLLAHPMEVTYHVINQSGQEAITYRKQYFSPEPFVPDTHFPTELRAYGVKDDQFYYYPLSLFDPDPLARNVFRLVSPSTAKSHSLQTFATFGNQGDIYVMYDADATKNLSGLYNLKLNDSRFLHYDQSTNTTSAAATSLTAAKQKDQENVWRIGYNNGDPYDVRLFNFRDPDASMSVAALGTSPTAANNQTYQNFILTAEDAAGLKFRLLACHSESATADFTPYAYLGLSDTSPQILTTEPQWFKLYPVTLGFTYKLYDLSGNLTMQADVTDHSDVIPSLPEQMRSPLVKEYLYYREEELVTPLTSLASSVDNTVHVTYIPYSPEESPLKLDGSEMYVMHANSEQQRLLGQSRNGEHWLRSLKTAPDYQARWYRWRLEGRNVNGMYDPYDVRFWQEHENNYLHSDQVNNNGSYMLRVNNQPSRFKIVQGIDGYYEILLNRSTDVTKLQYLYNEKTNDIDDMWSGRNDNGTTYVHGQPKLQIHIQPAYLYNVLNLQGKVAIRAIEARAVTGSMEPQIPSTIKSPAIKADGFTYYDITAFDIKDGIYTLRAGATPLTDLTEATTSDIFVYYSPKDISSAIDLTGQTGYNITAMTRDLSPSSQVYITASKNGNNVRGTANIIHTDDNGVATDDDVLKTDAYLWRFKGSDPYDIKIYNATYPAAPLYVTADINYESNYQRSFSFGGSETAPVKSFILLGGGNIKDGFDYKLMACAEATRFPYYFHLGTNLRNGEGSSADPGGDNNISLVAYRNGGDIQSRHYQLKLQPQNETMVTYVVMNHRNCEAIRMKVQASKGILPMMPEAIQSPYAKDFTFYSDAGCTTDITSTNIATDNATIYVRYVVDTDALDAAALDLRGKTGTDDEATYNIWVNGSYLYNTSADNRIVTDARPTRFDDTMHEWYLEGDASGNVDPYDVRLRSKQKPTMFIQLGSYDAAASGNTMNTLVADNDSHEVQAFILMDGQPGKMELLAATGAKTDQSASASAIDNRLMYLGYYAEVQLMGPGSNPASPVIQSGMNQVQVILRQPLTGVVYHIMNLNRLEAVQYTVTAAKGDALEVPEPIRSPFATNWSYFSDPECTVPLSTVPSAHADIYVTYTYDDATRTALQLDGERYYNLSIAGRYVQEDDGSIAALEETTLTTEQANVTANLWAFNGQTASKGIDPYALHLVGKGTPDIYAGAPLSYATDTETTVQMSDGVTENFRSTFFLVGTSAEGPYEMVLASGPNITDNILAIVNRHDDATINLNRKEDYQHGNAALELQLTSPVNKYLYKVYDRSGNLAIQAWGDGVAGDTPVIPQVIKSPLVSQFYYDVETLPYSTGTAEVRVTYDVPEDASLQVPNLNGTKLYNLKFRDDNFIKASGASVALAQDNTHTNLPHEGTLTESTTDDYIWKPNVVASGSFDPYAMRLDHSNGSFLYASTINTGANDLTLSTSPAATDYQRFILLDGIDGRYQFMAATGDDIAIQPDQNLFAYLGITNANQAKLLIGNAYTQDKTAVQVELVPFQYKYTYVVINNSGTQSLRYTVDAEAGDPVRIPASMKSSLLDYSDYKYYDEGDVSATTDFEYVTDFDITNDVPMTNLPYSNRVIYVRYDYTPKEGGLDLTGTIKYQIHATVDGNEMYMHAPSNTSLTYIERQVNPVDATDNQYAFKLEGSDPYNIKIRNVERDKMVSVAYRRVYGRCDDQGIWLRDDGYEDTQGEYWVVQHYMLLEHEDGGYRLMGDNHLYWQTKFTYTWNSGKNSATDGENPSYFPLDNATASSRWNFKHYQVSSGNTPDVGMQIFFTPLTTHNYRFHLTTKIDQRHLVVEKKNVMAKSPFSLPEELQRKYCTYTYYFYADSNDEGTRNVLTKETGTDDQKRSLEVINGIEYYPYFKTIDDLPEADKADAWVDIYVDYKAHQRYKTDDEGNYIKEEGNYVLDPEGMPFNVMGWNRASVQRLLNNEGGFTDAVFQISTYDQLTEPLLGTTFGLQRKDYLYFLVLKTDNDFTNNNGQYFLRREDNGRITWLNNDFSLHKDPQKNFKNWPYSRCAEAYRANDHSVFEDKKWLFCFAGDPYDFYIFNANSVVEEAFNEILDRQEFVQTHRDHLVSYTTLQNASGTTTEYAVNTPSYTATAPALYRWGLAMGQGTNSDETFSLITSEFQTPNADGEYKNPTIPNVEEKPLYWRMDKSAIENVSEVLLQPRAADNTTLDYNLQVLPYEPTKFEDLRFVLKRDDHVAEYLAAYPKSAAQMLAEGKITQEQMPAQSMEMSKYIEAKPSGTIRMFYSSGDRMFSAGDIIDTSNPEALMPQEMLRQFCEYKVYSDDYRTQGQFVVSGDFIRGEPQRDADGNYIFNESGAILFNFSRYVRDGSGNLIPDGSGGYRTVGSAPQTIYAKYTVTTDKFLKKAPTKEQVAQMVANNDHVYFMDFADPNLLKNKDLRYDTGHHAYFDEDMTFQPQIGTLYEGLAAEKRIWNGSKFVDDPVQTYNYCQYRTTPNRMESVPENLKWYFVGDPYKLQVYCTEDPFNQQTVTIANVTYAPGQVASNLCRFDPTETNFQFVVDCVHFRAPDETAIDERKTLEYEDEDGNTVTIDNANYGKPYYSPFYWEVVPTMSDDPQAFALRFRADNQVLGYRNVFYYLAHDGIKRTYREAKENPRAYNINLSYDEDNTRQLSGKYSGYHTSNNENCIIRLTEPMKVYFSAYKETFDGAPVVKEELSEYYGLGETITEVPRHLQRKFVKYGNLQYQKNNNATWLPAAFDFEMAEAEAFNLENCKDVVLASVGENLMKDGWVYQNGTKYDADGKPVLYTKAEAIDAGEASLEGKFKLDADDYTKCRTSFKFRVTYEVDDVTSGDVHLFTTPAQLASADVEPEWLDITVGGNNWLYYDKMVRDANEQETDTLHVTKYPVEQDATDSESGWDIGIKGLHWAMVGDPYKFTLINRRRWEDLGSPAAAHDGSNFWLGTDYGQHATQEKDADGNMVNRYYNYLRLGDTNAGAALNTGGTRNGNTEWSLMMCKTGSAADYFIRTSSPKTTSVDEVLVGDYTNSDPHNMTNDYWRVVRKDFVNLDGSRLPQKSAYVLEDFSLETKTKDIQKAVIHTAVAEDNDGANNDCFDAIVRVYNLDGELKATLKHVEVTYGDVVKSMPNVLRRYGCNYIECYQLSYNGYTREMVDDPTSDATQARTEAIKNAVGSLNNFTGKNRMGSFMTFSDATLDFSKAITDIDGRKYLEIAYVYEVDDEATQFFTSAANALQNEYYWSNAYYQWDQSYKGTNVRVVTYEDVFDHYEYNADGHIINEVYKRVEKVEYRSGEEISTPAYGWVNSHENSNQAFGDKRTQTEDNEQKWALVGDPYDFEMKNYAQYLQNSSSALLYTDPAAGGDGITASTGSQSHWAIVRGLQKTEVRNGKTVKVTDENGDPVYVYYLALIDDETGLPIHYVTFDRALENKDLSADKQYLYLKGGPLTNEPTGNFYTKATAQVKPFYLTELMSYASWVVYHLVIAHQHSLDYIDTGLTAADLRTIDQHLVEWMKYHMPDYMVQTGSGRPTETVLGTHMTSGTDTGVTDEASMTAATTMSALMTEKAKTAVKARLQKASLRDVVNDEIDDYSVQKVGIGNTLTVPWYMRRQFCNYRLFQRDVQRSVTSTRPALDDEGNQLTFIDPETGEEKPAYEIDWVSVTEDPSARGYATVVAENGSQITRLNDSHRNRRVIVDVVYTVNEDQFRFSDRGRNTTAWYSMLTNNDNDGLMNFSYKDGIGARHGRAVHYTNNYLWAPEGDPYGFILHSRYATINGTGWDNVVVTTAAQLPDETTVKNETLKENQIGWVNKANPEENPVTKTGNEAIDVATYTGGVSTIQFKQTRITHPGRGYEGRQTWGARNAVYEMFAGNYELSFLMHPTSAYIDHSGDKFSSFYMVHNTTTHTAELQYFADAKDIRSAKDANWRMMTTPEQLLPYFERAGYVGGLKPDIANRFENQTLYQTLQQYRDTYRTDPSVLNFPTIDRARELVYGGRFYKRGGPGNPYKVELLATDPRPTDNNEMPLKFVSNNLVPLTQGYYRIVAFSRDALDKDGEDLDGTGIAGIQGPRYISGYRFQSEKDYEGYAGSPTKTLQSGSRWLHFIETDEEHTTHKTFEELNAKIRSLDGSQHYERDIEPHPAMRGNIEILPAEYDPSSIFYFTPADDASDPYDRWDIGTQGLRLRGRAGGQQGVDASYGVTKLVDPAAAGYTSGAGKLGDSFHEPTGAGYDNFDDHFRINDIGGTAFTMRLRKYALGDTKEGTSTVLSTWDDIVSENLKTNYLCIDAYHRYRITIHKDNELKEIGDGYAVGTEYWKLSDINYGIQDTKWLLQPVGVRTQWPYNEKPLSVRVNKGGQKPDTSTGKGLAGAENEDKNYYASLYVPFDTRLAKTVDAAFTNTREVLSQYGMLMQSVSQLNNMGNPQFIPAAWPVVLRTSQPVTSITREDGTTMTSSPHVDLYLPNPVPTSIPESYEKINLYGSYLERELTAADITALTDDAAKAAPIRRTIAADRQHVMVLGLPFSEETGDKTVYGTSNSQAYYAYKTADAVGFYTNKNWHRGYYVAAAEANGAATATDFNAMPVADKSKKDNAHWATARLATSEQRNNKYVYNNKVFFVHDDARGGNVKPKATDESFYALLFDDETKPEAEEPDEELLLEVPRWGVYDLSGRQIRTKEAVMNGTWRRNLKPGMYIVNGRKLTVK